MQDAAGNGPRTRKFSPGLFRDFSPPISDLWRRGIEAHAISEAAETYPGASAGLSGAPPIETGPKGLGSRKGFLPDVLTTRARAGRRGMAEVVIGVAAFCKASARAASDES